MYEKKQDPDRVSVVKEAMELQVEACMKEEDEVAAASSSDTSVEENPEDDWFGTFTQAPVERGLAQHPQDKCCEVGGNLAGGAV